MYTSVDLLLAARSLFDDYLLFTKAIRRFACMPWLEYTRIHASLYTYTHCIYVAIDTMKRLFVVVVVVAVVIVGVVGVVYLFIRVYV